jgi:hypothetical protein
MNHPRRDENPLQPPTAYCMAARALMDPSTADVNGNTHDKLIKVNETAQGMWGTLEVHCKRHARHARSQRVALRESPNTRDVAPTHNLGAWYGELSSALPSGVNPVAVRASAAARRKSIRACKISERTLASARPTCRGGRRDRARLLWRSSAPCFSERAPRHLHPGGACVCLDDRPGSPGLAAACARPTTELAQVAQDPAIGPHPRT